MIGHPLAGALVDEQLADGPACRVCGCTDDYACDGGCWWVPDPDAIGDLCSSCLDGMTGKGDA